MQKKLVIVESPAKAKTIGKFLGKNYKVTASVGHIRDLPKSTLGIDVDNNYEPKYITIRGKGPVVKELKAEAKKADQVLLATDPDREGEAISWHLAHILKIDEKEAVRVEFNEITKDAVVNAIKNPRTINRDLVDAQQARRILDRLVGYKISPLLWRKIRKGLSAGRVQSVTVKIICDREEEIKAFVPEEYWSLTASHKKDNKEFESKFYGKLIDGKQEKIEISSEDQVNEILKTIDKDKFKVDELKKGTKRRNPYLPYTTSTLQQDASRRLGFSTKKTMMIAQQLYEGVDVKGEGTIGLVTYIRTDSTRISNDARLASEDYIKSNFGDDYLGKIRKTKNKKESQDAHEAIRPTLRLRNPEEVKDSLTKDQFKLYDLIFKRFLSSQMSQAIYDTFSISFLSNDNVFKTSGSKLKFEGFLKVYEDDRAEKEEDMPNLEENTVIKAIDIEKKQHFTQAPPRYTEASLIKTLEELGIGRPSTYAPTISTILSREYVEIENKVFSPTELGELVNELMEEHFENIVDKEFTADLEEQLDKVAEGETAWQNVIDGFYSDFRLVLEKADKEIEEMKIEDEVTDEICEKCGKNMVIKFGRFGKFLACPGYPDCKNTKAIVEKIDVECPECGGEIIKRKSKKRKVFYGCNNFPDCNFVSWTEPIKEKCPKCSSMMTKKQTKKEITKMCSNKDCGYKESEKR